MSHIECYRNHGINYLRICQAVWVPELKIQKKKIIKNIGPQSKYDDGKPDFLKRFRKKWKDGELSFDGITYECCEQELKNIFEFDDATHYVDFKNIGYLFLNPIFNQLGITDVLNKIKSESKIEYDLVGLVKLLVFERILNPKSKKKTYEERNRYIFPIVDSEQLKEIYRVLDVLNENSKKIQNRMNTKIKNSSIGRKTDLTYYDVTNFYFETMYGDEEIYETDENGQYVVDDKTGEIKIKEKGFKKKGVSKENRKEPIVQLGLFIDNNGLPVFQESFPGNMQDKTTFTHIIKTSINESDLGRIVVVADNGMNTQENLSLLTDKGNGYIISKSVKRCWKSYSPWIQDNKDYVEIKDNTGVVTFKYKSRIVKRTLKYTDKESGEKHSKEVTEKEIVYWSKKHYEKELHQNQKFIEYLESCKEHPDKLKDKQRKSQEFIKVIKTDPKTGEIVKTKDVVVLLEDKIQKYKETMGYYMVITSEINDDDREIINKYHGLSRIEDSFRIMKGDLDGRPVYVWIKNHIKAHFLICFIALTIIRIIQYKILKYENKSTLNVDGWEQGITAEKIKEALNFFEGCADKKGNCIIKRPSLEFEKIVKALNLEMTNLTTIDKINQFKNILNKVEL